MNRRVLAVMLAVIAVLALAVPAGAIGTPQPDLYRPGPVRYLPHVSTPIPADEADITHCFMAYPMSQECLEQLQQDGRWVPERPNKLDAKHVCRLPVPGMFGVCYRQ